MPLPNNVGFGMSEVKTYVIPNGATSGKQIDLGRPYAFIVIMCDDMAGVASGSLRLNVSPADGIPLHNLYEQNSATIWSSGTLPTSGTYSTLVTHAFGMRFIQPVLTANSDTELTFKIIGFDPVIRN